MSREIKRVPLDFEWPLRTMWKGYCRPDSLDGTPCAECHGSGEHGASMWLATMSQRFDMLASDISDQRRGNDLHPWLALDRYPASYRDENGNSHVLRPSEEILDLFAALDGGNRESYAGFGGRHVLYHALMKAAGLKDWHKCKTCDGHGYIEKYEGQFAEAAAWEQEEPPTGEGWQIWETVSDGSPVTPVFETSQALAEWVSSYQAGSERMGKEAALKLVEDGWAPTAIFYVPKAE